MDIFQVIERATPVATDALGTITATLAADPLGTIFLLALVLASGYLIKAWKGGSK